MKERLATLCLLASAVSLLVILAPGKARAEGPNDILIVANSSVPQGSASLADVRDIFLKRRVTWPSGDKATPVHAVEGPLREAFCRLVLGMSPAEEKTYWQERQIKYGVAAPPEFGNTLKAVFKLRGAVSYLYRSQFRAGTATVLLVVPAK
jgi:hypothetical protein